MTSPEESLVPYQEQPDETAPPKPLYQKSFKADFIGKRRPKSKQQVTWTIVQGTDTHTVMLTWSTRTGKVLIHFDGNEIDFFDKKGYSILQHKFDVRELGLNFEILATSVVPSKADPEFLCYECIINGKAFTSLPLNEENDNNRLLMETKDGTSEQPLLVEDGDSYSTDSDKEEDEATPYSHEYVTSVTDIVYPNGIPSK